MNPAFLKYTLIAVGGGLGAICRYMVQGIVQNMAGPLFPYGTLIVNVLGCFLIGLVMELAESRYMIPQEIRIFLTVGILGGFTTFSTFSYETFAMLKSADYFYVTLNVVVSVVAGLAAVWLGGTVGRLV